MPELTQDTTTVSRLDAATWGQLNGGPSLKRAYIVCGAWTAEVLKSGTQAQIRNLRVELRGTSWNIRPQVVSHEYGRTADLVEVEAWLQVLADVTPTCECGEDDPDDLRAAECCTRITCGHECGNCDRCNECCECGFCEGCDRTIDRDDICSGCGRCTGRCCDCHRCDNCGSRHACESDDWCHDCDRCTSCCKCSEVIQDYSTDVTQELEFKGTPADGVYFGVELEVEVRDDLKDTAERVQEIMRDEAILKHDSSVSNGFEIVTAPATLDEHKRMWEPFFNAIEAGEISLRSWSAGSSCGIHVHITRPKSDYVLGKMLVLVNNPLNASFLRMIAGRDSRQYAAKVYKEIKDARKDDGNRYQALNLSTRRRKTVELRIFKGTLHKVHFFADIECAHAIRYFCEDAGAQELTWQALWAWVQKPENRKTYRNFITYMSTKGYKTDVSFDRKAGGQDGSDERP